MTIDLVQTMMADMLWTAMVISAPILGIALLVGLVVSILQVITSIQEMTLTFVPKILAVALVILVFGQWMIETFRTWAIALISNIPNYLG